MLKPDNEMTLKLCAVSANESFARSAVAAFCVQLNPTLEQINDIKTAVSEAVTNSVVHAYEAETDGYVIIDCKIIGDSVYIAVSDKGCGKALPQQGCGLRRPFSARVHRFFESYQKFRP